MGVPGAKRGLGQARGAEVPDVDIPGVWLEAKRGIRSAPLPKAYAQALRDCEGTGRIPIAVRRLDRQRGVARLRLCDLQALGCDPHQQVEVAWDDLAPLVARYAQAQGGGE